MIKHPVENFTIVSDTGEVIYYSAKGTLTVLRSEQVTQAVVNYNLDNAIENHYDDITKWTAEDIAQDLMAYSSDFEDVTEASELVPYIENWLKFQGEKDLKI